MGDNLNVSNKDCERHGVRLFVSGATRDAEGDKYDYEGFISPRTLQRYAMYMHEHRKQSDGTLRDSDNWQKGIPRSAYRKSLIRHVIDLWTLLRIVGDDDVASWKTVDDLLCAIIFNAMGLLHERGIGRNV